MGPRDAGAVSRLDAAQSQFQSHKDKYEKLRADVAIKLKFLEENKVGAGMGGVGWGWGAQECEMRDRGGACGDGAREEEGFGTGMGGKCKDRGHRDGSLQGFDIHVAFVTRRHELGGTDSAEGEWWHSGGSQRAFQALFCAAGVGSGPPSHDPLPPRSR